MFRNMYRLIGFISVLLVTACVSTDDSTSNRLKTDKAMIHAQLARSYMQQKQYAVARDSLQQALRINPNHSDSNYVMALLMLELQQYDQVGGYFEKALQSNPENSSAAHDFGMFLCQTGEELRSVRYFDQAVQNPLFEKPDLSLMRAGECLAKVSDQRAKAYLSRALSITPDLHPALYILADINYQAREYLSGRAYIERYFSATRNAITKKQPQALLLAYKIELALGDEEVANDYKQKLLEGFPGSLAASQLRKQLRK